MWPGAIVKRCYMLAVVRYLAQPTFPLDPDTFYSDWRLTWPTAAAALRYLPGQ